MSAPKEVPAFLLLREPHRTVDLLVVDERIPLVPLFRALAEAGYTVINDGTGKLVITEHPQDWKP